MAVEKDGAKLVETPMAKDAYTLAFDNGTYHFTFYERPCDGNCGTLDPPTDACDIDLELKPDTQQIIDLAWSPENPCAPTLADS